ncbi:MAG: Prolyl-tRNA synthetase [Parcubacteria group bacterium GW2011_GWB1_35_5]|uniref:Proline--tRNA ligase n=1 Tax=Candidatus Zambryskibacteria bacterium RIFCSPLOWO2_01_FULL_35_19 TaxID=1802757 RepID=A0A1G2TY67_9BACT|nr:MAG: Prolyl-tRNA synthetase [Parcubacteria group bacterium GW2011_GWC1_34_10]KKP80574.1 MAG: Prolyl-tRNA synthetase [Parcubacteria group bacterium GW2011_GWB1_35_5]OHA86221.1 MAG: prolyl-tRNA synthetase [Candidatus Zambryskibacteria bacterium RIFCSPHIGHO2_01_FULL_35_32]OHB02227.1 MAG: prolyl-tRNA synthetase [Candidatus Zambryskibacteria bacterium RIFCSPLOWO2_01_FULL_35_19]
MRQSQLFTKTRREAPADETARNAQLLIQAGYIHKEIAGVYSFLPLGLKVIKNIENIIREEMNNIGGIEMKTTVLQNKEIWEKSGRWSDDTIDNWFKTKLKNGGEVGLSFTNEEAYSNILKQHISSYKDLPAYPYDFKEIFRNEARSKSGIIRGREFYWKALYSFSKNEAEHNSFYEKSKVAYQNIFERVGIKDLTYITFASGGSFSKFSHEFQTFIDAGEDIIYVDEKKKVAINKEVYNNEVIKSLGLKKEELVEKKAVEVGNIFTLGTKFSEPFDLKYKNEKGEENYVFMGCYGIGLGRLMGTIVEVFADDKGIIWPESVAPFKFHLIEIISNKLEVKETAEKIYKKLGESNVLYDDRDLRAGEKFADSDLLGMPYQIIISEKNIENNKLELKNRKTGEVKMIDESEIDNLFN